jgi:TorA maturation chaperone TorD
MPALQRPQTVLQTQDILPDSLDNGKRVWPGGLMHMKKDTHKFVQEYKGLGALGFDRETDEETLMFYLQKFSEDTFLQTFVPRLSDREIEEIYLFVNDKLKQHITEEEYHHLFLKDR